MEFLSKDKLEEEDQEEEEEEEEIQTVACDFFSNSHSLNQQWVEEGSNSNHFQDTHQQQPVMDLSLRIDTSIGIDINIDDDDNNNYNRSSSGSEFAVVEREHMFDKVVTPSDVGKLNRLVIPKQHAERYFPLDSTTNDKGLILNFEDRHGKPWRFRYSYWNSSQSYVMTKGWSRFVKDKKLDAGDVVSFQRGLAAKDRLFIDWRRRPDAPRPLSHFSNPPLFLLPQSLRWASGRTFTLPPPPPPPPQPRRTHHHPLTNYSNLYPNYAFEMPNLGVGSHGSNSNHNTSSNSMYYFRPSMSSSSSSSLYRTGNGNEIVVNTEGSSSMMGINKAGSGGATVTATAAKRLRLFGVNMECSATVDGEGGGEDDLSNDIGVSRRGKEPSSLNWEFL